MSKKIFTQNGFVLSGKTKLKQIITLSCLIAVLVGTVVKAFLSLLGIIFIGLVIYGGYNWMTARGDEAKVNKAKEVIQNAVIGLIITISAYAIWDFVFYKVI